MSAQPKQPDRKIRKLLDDVEAVTKGRFYEDPEPIMSPVEMFLICDDRPGGDRFDQLSLREKHQVLTFYTDRQAYDAAGITWKQLDEVFWNAAGGKPREQWLDGTDLGDQGKKQSLTQPKDQGKSENLPSRTANATMDKESTLVWMEAIRRLDAAYMAGGTNALAKMNGIEIHVLYSEKMTELEAVRKSLAEHGDNDISQLHKQKLERQTTDMAPWMRAHCPAFCEMEQRASKTSLAQLKQMAADRTKQPEGGKKEQSNKSQEVER